jgi:hypothetical protein
MTGQTGDLWIEGTFVYGGIVVMVNMTILYGTFSHTIGSLFIVFLSAGSFFVVFYLFSSIGVPTLASLFFETIAFKIYGPLLLFFFIYNFPIDIFLNFLSTSHQETITAREKETKRREKKKFLKGLNAAKLAPLLRISGYAFSGEAGHVP